MGVVTRFFVVPRRSLVDSPRELGGLVYGNSIALGIFAG